jgi:hypothetical protein
MNLMVGWFWTLQPAGIALSGSAGAVDDHGALLGEHL